MVKITAKFYLMFTKIKALWEAWGQNIFMFLICKSIEKIMKSKT